MDSGTLRQARNATLQEANKQMNDNGSRQRLLQMVALAISESEKCLNGLSAEKIEVHRGLALLDELLEEMKAARTPKERSQPLEKRIVAEGLHAAVMVRDIVAGFDRRGGPEQMDPWDLSEAMYHLGYAHALLTQLELRCHSDYRVMVHAIRSAEIVNKKHALEKEHRDAIIAPFAEYIRQRYAGGYRKRPMILYRKAINLPRFAELNQAIKPTVDHETGEITKRAVVDERDLKDLVRKIAKQF